MKARLFWAGVAVIGLHIADDSFIQPQPGTSASDHLVSGLVPLALLALAASAYPRLRSGAGASLSLALGLLGIGFSSEALRYWADSGLSGDDYTGLLSLAAGVVLIGLGFVTLWRSRRLDDSRLWRYPRRGLLFAGGVLVLAMVLLPVIVGYATTHIARSDKNTGTLDLPHVNVVLHTSDDLDLPGWYVPSRNGAAVIVFPGREKRQKYARMLARHGYGVLLFDRRGEGKADGDPEAFGWNFDNDVDAAVAYLQHRPDVERGRIGGLGLSVGGEALLQAASDNTGLAAVVSEGAGARALSEEMADMSGVGKWTSAPMLAIKTASVALFSNTKPPANLEKLIPKIAPRPVFLINALHNEVDHKQPEYFAAAGEPKQRWLVPKGGHVGGFAAMPAEYERRVIGFLDRSLPESRSTTQGVGSGPRTDVRSDAADEAAPMNTTHSHSHVNQTSSADLTVRPAGPDDAAAVRELAYLDSARPLRGRVVVAFQGGRAAAAMSLGDGRVVADPFVFSANAIRRLETYR